MSRIRKYIAFSTLCFFTVMQHSIAQRLPITLYDADSRLGIGGITCFQDSKGWMWAANGYETMRYDGHRFKSYPPIAGFPLRHCYDVFEVDKEIWVLSQSYTFKVIGDSLYPIFPFSKEKDILGCVNHKGINYFITQTGLYQYLHQQFIPVVLFKEFTLARETKLINYNDSVLVAAQSSEKLLLFNLNQKTVTTLPLSVTDLVKGHSSKTYLLVDGKGVQRLDKINWNAKPVSIETNNLFPLNQTGYNHMILDGQNNFWLSKHNDYLALLSPGKPARHFKEKEGLPNLLFNEMIIDRENNIWIGAVGALYKIKQQDWQRFTITDALTSNFIPSLVNYNPNILLAISANGINAIEKNKVYTIKKANSDKALQANYFIHSGKICYFTKGIYLYQAKLDTQSFQIKEVKLVAQTTLNINALKADTSGNIYLLTKKAVLVFYKNKLHPIVDALYSSNDIIKEIFIDKQQQLWAGGFGGGLNCYQLQFDAHAVQAKKLFYIDSINNRMPPLKAIRAIAQNKNGWLFVGTRYNGLFVLNPITPKKFTVQHFNEADGLSSNSIWGLEIDKYNHCWIANAKGLNKLIWQNHKWLFSDEGTKRNIQAAGMVVAGNQSIWTNDFPGIMAINYKTNLTPKPFFTFITNVTVNGKTLNSLTKNKYSFDYLQNSFKIDFSANTYLNEQAVLYSYYLNGPGGGYWSEPATTHTVNFSALKAGTYHFKVKAKNINEQWSQNVAEFKFKILLPFYKQAWFIIGVGIVVLLLLYFLYRYRIAQLQRVEKLRQHIARDLHDEIGSTLSSISILSKVSKLNLKKNQTITDELLSRVIDQSKKMQQNLSDIVWTIKPDNDRLKNLVAYMRTYLAQTLEPVNITIHFYVEETLLHKTLGMEMRHDFFLLFKEAITNISKHSNAKNAYINFNIEKDKILLKICDDGLGVRSANNPNGNGINNMKARAESLKGNLILYNNNLGGCCIELMIPTKK